MDIPVGTIWAHFIVDISAYFYEAEFIQTLIKDKLITAG
jgi:hypothetical protein